MMRITLFHLGIRHVLPPILVVMCLLIAPDSIFSATLYVDGDNCQSCPVSPYANWGEAALDIADAIGAATVGDTVVVRASTATYGGFAVKDGVTVTAEDPGTAYPVLSGANASIDFNGDMPNGAIVEYLEVVNAGSSIYFSADTPTGIDNNTILRNMIIHGGSKAGIRHENGSPIIENNVFYDKNRVAIRIYESAGSSSEAMIIRNNEIYGDGVSGGAQAKYAEIHFDDTYSGARYVLIQDNIIHDNSFVAGISFAAGENYVYITGNQIYSNPKAGIHVIGEQTGHITISGEQNFTFAGTSYTNGSPNEIYTNSRGGITTEEAVTMDIISNEIYDNLWGGISTNKDQIADGAGFNGAMGSAVLTIRKNKIYGNGNPLATIGGGIDVRHASGTIENNVIYKNKRAGIRIGWEDFADPHVTDILNNTVVSNGGQDSEDRGGGIVYDDLAGAVDDPPAGNISDLNANARINVKNNIIAYTKKAALKGLNFTNTSGYERDYNLLYSNNPGATWMTPDCNSPDYNWRCIIGQYGFSNSYLPGPPITLVDPHDMLADPVFVDMDNDDYQLDQDNSPGVEAGSDSTDMGAWGGTYYMDW